MKILVRSLSLVATLVVLATCGGGDSAPPSVAVQISPTSVQLKPGDAQYFNVAVSGSADTDVTWTVQEGAAGGSIDSLGTYTADLNNGTFHVIATSKADQSKSATATVTVAGPFLVTPSTNILGPNGVSDFSANGTVTWSVQEGAAGGLITAAGRYTAPGTPGQFHVIATSVQDSSKTMLATVTVVTSGFMPSAVMSTGRTGHTATVLQNGKALITGGDNCYFSGYFYYYAGSCPLDSAEIFDPATGTFTVTGTMRAKREFHTATLLGNGKVLLTGGPDASAELYDPSSGSFTATGSMSIGRSSHTATLLTNGKVLIVGGVSVSGDVASAELYDSSSGTFSATGSMTDARAAHTATLLADGRVLVAGGVNSTGTQESAEAYDPATGTFSGVASMSIPRSYHTATLLANSTVLLAGGDNAGSAVAIAELFNSIAGAFTTTGQGKPRSAHAAVLLANGSLLVAGGADSTAELYNPTTGAFVQTGSTEFPRIYPAAVLLPDGRVLITGGSDSNSAELYQ